MLVVAQFVLNRAQHGVLGVDTMVAEDPTDPRYHVVLGITSSFRNTVSAIWTP